MTTQQTALEHLRVIRSLLEKSQAYRAISAPAALGGGVLALVVSAIALNTDKFSARHFLFEWLGILVVVTALNFFLLHREASARARPFVSEGMRMALRAFFPPMIVGGLLGVGLIWFRNDVRLASLIWILCYGLALLATAHFSPRSLVRLGWAFLVTGMALSVWFFTAGASAKTGADGTVAYLFLGTTFGVLHIMYAVAVFVRSPKEQDTEA